MRSPSAMAAGVATTLSNFHLPSNPFQQQQQQQQPPSSAPPAYSQAPAPALPARSNPSFTQPAPPPPEKAILAHARAIYAYQAADARDVGLEAEDRIAVYDYVNDQWWMGRNLRTGQEGIFPKTYVEVEKEMGRQQRPPPPPVPMQTGAYPGSHMGPVNTATLGNVGGPPPPDQGAVYDANAPPPGDEKQSKMEQHGKKFGKKLG